VKSDADRMGHMLIDEVRSSSGAPIEVAEQRARRP
jgi:hypothetical protein